VEKKKNDTRGVPIARALSATRTEDIRAVETLSSGTRGDPTGVTNILVGSCERAVGFDNVGGRSKRYELSGTR